TNVISALPFAPDGKTLATVGGDGTARLWDSATAETLGILWVETNSLCTVAFSSDGRILAAGTARLPTGKRFPSTRYAPPADGMSSHITLYDLRERKILRTFDAHADGVYSLQFSHDGKILVSGGKDGVVNFWDSNSGALQRAVTNSIGPVYGISFAPKDRSLATTGWQPTSANADLQILSSKTGQALHQFDEPGQVVCLAYSPDGATLATAGTDQLISLWDVTSGRLRAKFTGHTG